MTSRTAYPSYKPSGIDWLGDIPSHWDVRKLKHSVELSRQVVDAKHSGKSYVGLEHVGSGTGNILGELDSQDVVGLALEASPGNVIFGKLRPYLAKVALIRDDVVTSTEFFALEPVSTTPEYLQRLLISAGYIDLVDSSTYGAKMPRANWEFVGNTRIPLPPLDEQRAIADYLDRKDDEITRFIESRRRMIALLEEKKQAIINQAVTRGLDPTVPMKDSGVEWLGEIPAHWEVMPLLRLIEERADYRGRTPEKVDSGTPLITARNIRMGWIDYETSREFVRSDKYDEIMSRGKPELDDILFTMEAPLGNVALVDKVEIALAQRVIRLRPDRSRLSPHFALKAMVSKYFQYQLTIRATGSTALGLKASKLPQLVIVVPSVSEQKKIADLLAEVEQTTLDAVSRYQREIELMQEYRMRLISDVVTGKVRVT